ncbi:MAG: sensor histidine kinase [Alkalispirochaeta sp.]
MNRSLGTLWARTIFGTVAAAVVVFTITLWITLGPLVQRWQQEAGARIHDQYGESLSRLVAITGTLNRRDVRDLLEPQAEDGSLSIVWDATGYPLYWSLNQTTQTLLPPSLPTDSRRPQLLHFYETVGRIRVDGVRVDLMPGKTPVDQSVEQVSERMLASYRQAGLVSSIPSGTPGAEPLGYFVAGATSYGADSPTGGVIRALLTALLSAVAVTAGVSAALIVRTSSRVNHAMTAVLARLDRLGGAYGAPDTVDPYAPGVREFDLVAREISSISEELDRERTMRHRWAQDIAHDLRTPIAAMRAQLEGMIDGVFDRDDARLERLAGNLSRLESLAQSFLLLTKLESPDYPMQRKAINLAMLLDEVTNEYADRARAVSRPIIRVLNPSIPPVITADPVLLTRGIHNLLDNALVHGTTGPIEISARQRDEHPGFDAAKVEIRVTNTGTLDKTVAANPFDRFARGEHGDGHGLGLSVVHAVAQLHGGHAWAQQATPETVVVGFSIHPADNVMSGSTASLTGSARLAPTGGPKRSPSRRPETGTDQPGR